MKKNEFFAELDKMEIENKQKLLNDYCFEKEKNASYDQSNKGKPWTDDELKVVLSFAPTKENCLLLARAFKRGYGSIEQIYRWAVTDISSIKKSERINDSFILQIKRVYKEMGWRT